ncbi:hypothetical protein, partial [Candidatus Liberibacter asiaticus]
MNFRIAMLISFLASGCVAHALLTKKIESDTDSRHEKATISLSAHDKEGSKHTMNAEFSVPKNDEKYTISSLTKKIESDTDFRREKATISLSAHDKEGSKHTMNAEFSV